MVDNGNGITITGGDKSTVTITSERGNIWRSFLGHTWLSSNAAPAIASSTGWLGNGNGISIKAGVITLKSVFQDCVYSGIGKGGKKFKINLDASYIDITGTINGAGGDITINPKANV